MPILWRPTMAVGQATIDADHQRLVDLINAAETALGHDGATAELTRALIELTRYAKEHFEREEGLMISIGYAGLGSHRECHRDLRTRLAEFCRAFEHAKSAGVSDQEKARLTGLLRDWLLDHVLKEDMRLKPLWNAPGRLPEGRGPRSTPTP